MLFHDQQRLDILAKIHRLKAEELGYLIGHERENSVNKIAAAEHKKLAENHEGI